MKYRFKEVVDSLEFDELMCMRDDVDSGGFVLKKILDDRIKELEQHHNQCCATCSVTLDKKSIHNFTMVFGPEDFKKKASFCGMDCMEYFLRELKELKVMQ